MYLLFGDHDDISAFVKAKELVAKNGMNGIPVKSVESL